MVTGLTFILSLNKLTQTWCLFRCDNCSAVSLATSQVPTSDFREMTTSDSSNFWTEQERNAKWYPKPPIVGKDFPGVPQHIAEAASEAYKCRSISAFRASVLLARSVIEATAKDKRIAHGNLSAKIDELFDQRFIRKHIRDGSTQVRFLGNEMAHGDFVTPIADEERELILILMSEILDEVYQSPARVAKARAARTARQTSAVGQSTGRLSPGFGGELGWVGKVACVPLHGNGDVVAGDGPATCLAL